MAENILNKIMFLPKPIHPVFKMSSMAVKFAHNCEHVHLVTAKNQRITVLTHLPTLCMAM